MRGPVPDPPSDAGCRTGRQVSRSSRFTMAPTTAPGWVRYYSPATSRQPRRWRCSIAANFPPASGFTMPAPRRSARARRQSFGARVFGGLFAESDLAADGRRGRCALGDGRQQEGNGVLLLQRHAAPIGRGSPWCWRTIARRTAGRSFLASGCWMPQAFRRLSSHRTLRPRTTVMATSYGCYQERAGSLHCSAFMVR